MRPWLRQHSRHEVIINLALTIVSDLEILSTFWYTNRYDLKQIGQDHARGAALISARSGILPFSPLSKFMHACMVLHQSESGCRVAGTIRKLLRHLLHAHHNDEIYKTENSLSVCIYDIVKFPRLQRQRVCKKKNSKKTPPATC